MYYFSTTFALLSSLSVKSFLCILFDQQSLNLGPVPSTLNILSKRTYFRYLPTYCIVNICFQAKSFKMSIKPSVPTNTTDVYIASLLILSFVDFILGSSQTPCHLRSLFNIYFAFYINIL